MYKSLQQVLVVEEIRFQSGFFSRDGKEVWGAEPKTKDDPHEVEADRITNQHEWKVDETRVREDEEQDQPAIELGAYLQSNGLINRRGSKRRVTNWENFGCRVWNYTEFEKSAKPHSVSLQDG